jgi:hypothetical protein
MAVRRVVIDEGQKSVGSRRDRSNFAVGERSQSGRMQTCVHCAEPTANPIKWKDEWWCVADQIRDRENDRQREKRDNPHGGEQGVSVGLAWAFSNKEAQK